MEFSNNKQALLYIDRNGFYYYGAGQSTILNMAFLPTSVKDLDVVDQKSLENQIQTFSLQAKLVPSTISIIISPNLVFEKDIVTTDPQKQKEEMDKFISLVPFDTVASKTFPIQNGIKVIGVNEDIYLSIKTSFEKLGSIVTLVIPYQSLGADSALINNFTAQNVATILKRLDRLKEFNLLPNKDRSPLPQGATDEHLQNTPNIKKNKRAYLMVGLLVVLLVILGYLLVNLK